MTHYDAKDFSSRNSLGYLLKVNHALVHECAEPIFAQQDVSFIQWIAMRKLHEGLASTASDLCRDMCHDNGAVTRMLDQLEERGYVERTRSQQDRRVVNLQLTPAGKRKVNQLTAKAVESFNEALAPLSAQEFSDLIRLLQKLSDTLQERKAQTTTSPRDPS